MELQPIVHVWINHDHDLVDLTITKTVHGKTTKPVSEVLHTNKRHPFLTVEKGFLPVGQITLGMHIVEANGQTGVVSGWKVVPGVMTMYNLEVALDHTYTVGMGMWVVHNSNCGNEAYNASQQAVDLLQNDTNKMNHIFGKAQHNWPLTGLDQDGNLELIRKTIEENHSSIVSANSSTEFAKSFGNFAVTVRSIAVQGVIRVGTAWVN